MPDYRRAYLPGGTYFLTMITNQRIPILKSKENVSRLRSVLRQVMAESPFRVPAAVVLPDPAHFLWSLPSDDVDYSRRVGRMKVLFTRSLHSGEDSRSIVSESRRKHGESDVWQRRFWEHVVKDEEEFERYLHYIHYNPVKHGHTTCPHLWPFSSFKKWSHAGLYDDRWGCSCTGQKAVMPSNVVIDLEAGE